MTTSHPDDVEAWLDLAALLERFNARGALQAYNQAVAILVTIDGGVIHLAHPYSLPKSVSMQPSTFASYHTHIRNFPRIVHTRDSCRDPGRGAEQYRLPAL